MFAFEKGKDIMLIYIVMHYQRIGTVVAKLLEAIGLWYSTVNFHRENYRNVVPTGRLVELSKTCKLI